MSGHERHGQVGVLRRDHEQEQVRRRLVALERELEEHRAWLEEEPLLHRHERAA